MDRYDEQASRESTIYPQGAGWIVSVWSDAMGMNVTSGELPEEEAQARLARFREARAEELRAAELPRESGRRGGLARSIQKAAAARENGRKGGRPPRTK
jgi:hypothetical protein